MSKDLFSKQASIYAKYRPSYPMALIDYVAAHVNNKEIAWDCATGNGQAAVLLANHFENIFATDISEKQISHATQSPAVTYSIGEAERTFFADNTFDLITVAQAYHWFHFENFSKEATRVAKPDAIVAIWCYGLLTSFNTVLDAAIQRFYSEVVGKYWDPERKYVDEEYKTIPFYFNELPTKEFKTDVYWTWDDFSGYLNTWSSVQHFIKTNHYNPVDNFSHEIENFWEPHEKKKFSFPIFLRIGKVSKHLK